MVVTKALIRTILLLPLKYGKTMKIESVKDCTARLTKIITVILTVLVLFCFSGATAPQPVLAASSPVAVNDAYSVAQNNILDVAVPGVLANDTDADGDTLTAVLVSGVSNGSLVLNTNGSFSYRPNAGFNGRDSFTYKANDGTTDSNTATVAITVLTPISTFGLNNGNWTASISCSFSDRLNTMRFQNTAGSGLLAKLELFFDTTTPVGKVRLGVYADNNGVPGSQLLDAGEVTVANGWVSISGLSLPVTQNKYYWLAFDLQSANGVKYLSRQPANSHYWVGSAYGTLPGQFNVSSLSFNNDSEAVMRATVAIGANSLPVAVNDAYSVDEDNTLSMVAPGVLGNDTDADGDHLTAVAVSGPTHGTLTLNVNGSFIYRPNANFNGSDSFTYRANDGRANSNTATVSITVWPVNDAPLAVNDAYSMNEDTTLSVITPGVLGNDTDVEGDHLTATVVSGPTHGTLTLNVDGSFTYMPNANFYGNDSFTYKANDGGANSNTAIVSITISVPITKTFGFNNGSNTWNEKPNTMEANKFQNTAGTGMLTKLELMFENPSPVGKVRLGVYADNGGVPGNLLKDAGEVAVASLWVSISGLNLPVTQNTYYWLVFDLQNYNAVRYWSGQPSSSHYWASCTYGAFPSQYPVPVGSNNNEYVMRATVVLDH